MATADQWARRLSTSLAAAGIIPLTKAAGVLPGLDQAGAIVAGMEEMLERQRAQINELAAKSWAPEGLAPAWQAKRAEPLRASEWDVRLTKTGD